MFKRQYYALEHSAAGSSSSSSSLDTASDGECGPDVEDDGAWPAKRTKTTPSNTSEEISDVLHSEEDGETSDAEPGGNLQKGTLLNQWAEAVDEDEADRVLGRFEGSTVIFKGSGNQVLKCRLCPKVVCLSAESMEAHLTSKGHARGVKQLSNGNLKIQLDSDGEEVEEGETHAERFSRTISAADQAKACQTEENIAKRKRDSGRQRQRKRMKRKALRATKSKSDNEAPQALFASKVLTTNVESTSTTGKHKEGKLVRKQRIVRQSQGGPKKEVKLPSTAQGNLMTKKKTVRKSQEIVTKVFEKKQRR